jgi:hypothetical protein
MRPGAYGLRTVTVGVPAPGANRLPALQTRWNALASSVVLGLVWGVWYRPLMVVYGDPLVPTCC